PEQPTISHCRTLLLCFQCNKYSIPVLQSSWICLLDISPTYRSYYMHWIDLSIMVLYLVGMLCFGFFFLGKNKGGEDYLVGGREMSSLSIGLSVVATDVGGGFSI